MALGSHRSLTGGSIVAMSDIESVLTAALRLPVGARAAVVAQLLESLDESEPAEAGVEEAWAAEAERRLAEIDAGAVNTVPWSEARKRLLAAAHGEREDP
jgi:putative addiction module component (TIGR02574 family)